MKVKVVNAYEPDNANEVFFVTQEEPYKCNKCLFKCMDKDVRKNHAKKEHSVKCCYCKFTFKDTHRLENHVNIAHRHMTPMLQELMERQFPLNSMTSLLLRKEDANASPAGSDHTFSCYFDLCDHWD